MQVTFDFGWLRKAAPYLALFGFIALVLIGPDWLQALLNRLHGVGTGTPANMSSAEVAAETQAAGWPPAGTVLGKLATAACFFLFFVVLMWLTQQLTHPGPTKWAKTGYTDDFDALPAVEKFGVYQRIRLNYTILAAAAMLAASLVQ